MLGPPQAQGGFNPQMAGGPSRQGGPGQMLGPPQAQGGPVRQMGGPQQAGGPVQQMTPNTPAMPASIWDVYNSAIPVMQMERDRNIGQSLSQAGFNGTRFSTGAQNNVAQIGADTALRQNELLANLMYGQGQSDADRALQATGQGMQLGNQIEQMNRNRIGDLFNMGAWEQQRGDSLAQAPYQDYQANMRGWLPELLSLIGAQGAASYVPPITTTQGGSPGLLDYASQVPWYMFAA